MTLPVPKARKIETAKPKTAPADAASRTAATGAKPVEGTEKVETQVRGQGFGLSTAGGTGGELRVDGDFCCQAYLAEMAARIQASWIQNQRLSGMTTMQFTVQRDGSIRDPKVEKSSGFAQLDAAAERALRIVRLSGLPKEYPNQTLTVHLEFVYTR
jgi:TonB family protein